MSWTYDVTTAVGQVRLLIRDTDPTLAILQDEEIESILQLEGGDIYVRYAAAQCLELIASSQVLILKTVKTMDVETDGAAVSAELRELAKQLRQNEENMGAFDWAEQADDAFTFRERIFKQFIRQGC